MNITVNGEITVCNEGATLLDLILRLGLSPEKIVMERNRDIVPRRDVCRNRLAGRRHRSSCCSLSAAGKEGYSRNRRIS